MRRVAAFSIAFTIGLLFLTAASNVDWPSWIDENKGYGRLNLFYDDREDAGDITHRDGSTINADQIRARNSVLLDGVSQSEIESPTTTGQIRLYHLQSSLRRDSGEQVLAAVTLESTTVESVVTGWIAAATDRPLLVWDYLNDSDEWVRNKLDVVL